MKNFDWTQDFWCVVKADFSFAGIPCASAEEAYELSCQHKGSAIYKMSYDWEHDPFGLRFISK